MGLKHQLLDSSFYLHDDVVQQARSLLGCRLFTRFNGALTSGMITETEAYAGITDRASHAYGGRYTERTEVMYRAGGIAYVYFCYGMYHLFNVVTASEGTPHAVLIRAVEPLEGIELMMERRGRRQLSGLSDGPGKLCIALGINRSHNKMPLDGRHIGIETFRKPPADAIVATPRIGVHYAGDDALLPYRFVWNVGKGNPGRDVG
ncbi:MAG TPA: DNA-3-methyladenine glycosylase [Bacteroidales bacterium]|nr:DNA-3-methyladenine glycosylase [Bacteroidales bacterium]